MLVNICVSQNEFMERKCKCQFDVLFGHAHRTTVFRSRTGPDCRNFRNPRPENFHLRVPCRMFGHHQIEPILHWNRQVKR